jgi:hypothetical protein
MFRNLVLLALLSFASVSLALGQSSSEMRSVSCSFQDGTGMVVRYSSANADDQEVPYGSIWNPGGTPFVLMTETPLQIGNTHLPIGGYRIYLRPDRTDWSLIVNDGVTVNGYDSSRDLARIGMQSGELSKHKSKFKVSIVRTNPSTCSLTVYHGKRGYWADFTKTDKAATALEK